VSLHPSIGAIVAASPGLQNVLYALLELYILILIARALMSWFPITSDSPAATLARVLERLTEPVLRPIRRILPPVRAGGMAIDLSIIIAIVGIQVVGRILISYV
jgi:YggT family protein